MSTCDTPAGIVAAIRRLAAADAVLPEVAIRDIVNAATLLYAKAAADARREVPLADPAVDPTALVVLACALLRAGDLNPFDLALWFGRVPAE
jgi:hypothetical protein